MFELPPDVAVFALVCDVIGQWFALAPAVRELSGRHGIRRVAVALNSNGVPHRGAQYPHEPRRRCRPVAELSWLEKLNNEAAVRPAATLSWLEKLRRED